MRVRMVVGLLTGLALCACSSARDGETNLRRVENFRGAPEEFGIVPNKPLQAPPAGRAALPAPTPGGANRADLTPLSDTVAALGGDPSRLSSGAGIPASDGALVAAAGRRGVNPTVRQDLAREDAAFRRRASILNWRIVREDEYNRAYRRQSLDAQAWLDRVRVPGTNIRTPSAPPPAR
ncbi:hypothetical protein ROJ8625_03080 [Roseivivax jejudonensis]|uniref:Beta-barrel assembly machine subunit BamF n=1 Tax=Roseivivax jejudonensis TaxID=1529041 RepID=A0A1X6ZT45_9RHOB|nr:DUF3035 domain-containing protein [Roseivivax jejudonensis]SLN60719.1 hypothetical protein ROJ8625_03080 [Roseivivax jejudonensis]